VHHKRRTAIVEPGRSFVIHEEMLAHAGLRPAAARPTRSIQGSEQNFTAAARSSANCMERVTKACERESVRRRILELLDAHGEWFCTEQRGRASIALRKSEWEVKAAPDRLLFSYWGDAGARAWRIVGWEWTGEKLLLEATRRMGAERAMLELVPRASASAAAATLTAARRAACEHLAALARATLGKASVERMGLSRGTRRTEPGRYARILLRRGCESVAVTGPVVALSSHDADAFLASALVWFTRLGEKARSGPSALWLIVTRTFGGAVAERLALLRGELRRVISLYETDDEKQTLVLADSPGLGELLTADVPRFRYPAQVSISEWAVQTVRLAPHAIDVVHARRGETLRFHGLAFARVRRIMNREYVWFGIGRTHRTLLDEKTWPELAKLVCELAEHRRAEEPNDRRHALYTAAPEAWLESLLRRDITQLDPGLIISPLHTQFRLSRDARAGARPVDLLALRRDGQLVVIELKVSEDAALPLQGADYWRRIETYRRNGQIAGARLFGDARISDEPPLVYLVAPIFRFHHAFRRLARTVTPGIEMYRFDINEDWRSGVRVMRRTRVN